MSQAARIGDQHLCPKVEPGPKPHVGGPIIQGEPTVLIEGQPAARVGDQATCMAPPDTISRGAFPVLIGGKPAARLGDPTVHGGVITAGAATVFIGTAGMSGNPWVGDKVFKGMAAGRVSGSAQQSYNNCGVESTRQLINHSQKKKLNEAGLLRYAIDSGKIAGVPGQPLQFADGGSTSIEQRNILQANGVPAHTASSADPLVLDRALGEGKGVIVALDATDLWPTTAGINAPRPSFHAVVVTGIEYNDQGQRVAVILNDTGTGQFGVRAPPAVFDKAVAGYAPWQDVGMVVTDKPIW